MKNKGIIIGVTLLIAFIFTIVIVFIVQNNIGNKENDYSKNSLINLSYKELKIKIGEKFNLAATYRNEYGYYSHLIYESENPKIVDVEKDSGNIKGIKSGKAKIKVYVEVNPDIYTYCDVTVLDEIYNKESKQEQQEPKQEQQEPKQEQQEPKQEQQEPKQEQQEPKPEPPKNEIKQNEPNNNNIAVQNIVLNRSSLSLNVGESEKINATVKPDNATNKKVIWKSSNTSIATVDSNGTVLGVSPGSTVIIVISDDGNYTTSIPVTVIKPTINVSGVTLNKNNITLLIGQTDSVVATVMPSNATNKSVTYSSSNPTVATVDQNGNIKAIAQGEATIIVTTSDKKMTASCKVTVNAPIKVSSINLSLQRNEMMPGETQKINVTVNPSNATNKTLKWSYDLNVVTVDQNGNIKAIEEGIIDICAYSTDGVDEWSNVRKCVSLEVLPAKGDVVFSGNKFVLVQQSCTDSFCGNTQFVCKAGKEYSLELNARGWQGTYGTSSIKFASVKSFKSSDTSIATISRDPNAVADCVDCALTKVKCKKKGTVTITATNSLGGKGTIKLIVK